ncbi:MAG: DNA-binding protein [Firmicutes bacterium]|nr:DNA-binding protein [Bacillota bacterium]
MLNKENGQAETTNNGTVARMRGIRETVAYLKDIDPNTAITYGFIRRMCESGELSYILAGRKILINLDELLARFGKGGTQV